MVPNAVSERWLASARDEVGVSNAAWWFTRYNFKTDRLAKANALAARVDVHSF